MHLSFVTPTIPLGQWVEKGGDLTKQVCKHPTIWANRVIKSPSKRYSLLRIRWGFVKI